MMDNTVGIHSPCRCYRHLNGVHSSDQNYNIDTGINYLCSVATNDNGHKAMTIGLLNLWAR